MNGGCRTRLTPTFRQERASAQADSQRSAYWLPMLILNVLA